MHESRPSKIAGESKSPRKSLLLPATIVLSLFCLGSSDCGTSKKDAAILPSPTVASAISSPSPAATAFPAPVLSGVIPVAVSIPGTVTSPEQARPFFDTFSWQSFVALSWPAVPGQRGVALNPSDPQSLLTAPNGTVVVWGTYKESFDLFGQRDQRPTAWELFANRISECKDQPEGVKSLAMLTKGDSILDESKQAFSFPLIDQNRNYARYEVRYNKAFYDFVRGSDSDPKSWLYQIANLARVEPVSMPASPVAKAAPPDVVGALMVKAAWREMTDKDDRNRYYVVAALLYDPATQNCVQKDMGLVGFHIAQKLSSFPEWIWSSFEQVDNVARGPGALPTTPISFNNGTDDPKTIGGYANRPDQKGAAMLPQPERTPVQVTRLNPIPKTPAGASTLEVNAAWQQALKGSVWQNYELVITQWPSNPTSFMTKEAGGVYPKDCGAAFPENGATNTTMETYFQSSRDALGAGGNSCMSCHYGAGQSDFSWGLNRRSH
jgi:hypothetical protein